MEILSVLWLIALPGAVVGLLVSEWKNWKPGVWVFKTIASAVFVAGGIAAYLETRELFYQRATGPKIHEPYSSAILAGLVLSFFGDVFLIPKGKSWFLVGVGAFLLAHVAYSSAFVARMIQTGFSAGGLALGVALAAPVALVAWRSFVPGLKGGLRKAVPAYIVVISIMVCCAFAVPGAALAVRLSAVCFFVSDLAVARHRFLKPSFSNKIWGLPLYYFAQALFASLLLEGGVISLD